MVRPRDIIADRFRSVTAQEHRARVTYTGGQVFGVVGRDLEVFRRDPVNQRQCRFQIVGQDHGTEFVPALLHDLCPGQRLQVRIDGGDDVIGERRIIGDHDRLRGGIVLGLAEQVGRDPGRIVLRIRQHQNFGRSGDHVDPDGAEDFSLGGGDIGISRPDDFVDGLNGFSPISQRAHRLRDALVG